VVNRAVETGMFILPVVDGSGSLSDGRRKFR